MLNCQPYICALRRLFPSILMLAVMSAMLSCAAGSALHNPRPAGAIDIPAALAELEALQAPEGVDGRVFQELKSALADALEKRTGKIASTPPTGPANGVLDLSVASDAGSPRFSWHYRNIGDYDQNGTVGISDITPLAMNYGAAYDINTQPNTIAAVVDGDGSGTVGISDVTPIAMYFTTNCSAYIFQNSATASSANWSDLQEVLQASGEGDGRLQYTVTIDASQSEYYRVIPVDADGAEGEPSNVVHFGTAPPSITTVSPTTAVYGTEVQFSVSVSGSQPITLAWDFGDAGTPRFSSDQNPVITITNVKADYQCSVEAINAFGSDIFEFTITVGGNPPQVQSVDYTDAYATLPVTFSAVVTGDEPISYSWEFSGGLDTLSSTEQSPTLTANAEGTFNGTLLASNEAGSHEFPFSYSIAGPPELPEILDVGPTGGEVNSEIRLNANVRGSEPLIYTWYFGGAGTTSDVNAVSPYVTLSSTPGTYDGCSLALENAFGTDVMEFAMTVSADFVGVMIVVDNGGPSDPPDSVGSYCRLIVADGIPAIAYHNSSKKSLEFIRATNPYGTEWAEPSITVVDEHDAGTWMDAAVVDGKPAVAYHDATNKDLKFVRALDAQGTYPWGVVQTLDDDGTYTTGRHCTICFVGDPPGFPAVSYYKESGALMFVRSEDKEGFSWLPSITLDDDSCGVFNSAAVVQGNPAISYRAYHDEQLRFLRANDSLGDDWPTTPVIAQELHDPWYTCLFVIDGKPSIVYQNDPDGYLMFIRSVDEFGNDWGEPEILDNGGASESDTGQYTSLQSINGLPAVAYYAGYPDGALMYVVAQNAWGGSWNPPVMVDSGGDNYVGMYASLKQVAGRPAIAYYDSNDYVLKYVIANDPYGHDWPAEP